jgi:hypothetical protein
MQFWWVRSCGFFGGERFAKYDGAPTTAIRMFRSDTHCDHILCHLLAGSHAGVITMHYREYPELSRQGLPASFIKANKSASDGAVFALI